jgi:hypothetical protein
MPIHAIARLIQTMLYARRFFPYYVYNILGGIEDDGQFSLVIFTTHPVIPDLSEVHITHSFILFQALVQSTLLIL